MKQLSRTRAVPSGRFHALAGRWKTAFESIYDCGITDARTTYALCWGRLTVRQEEPLTALRE